MGLLVLGMSLVDMLVGLLSLLVALLNILRSVRESLNKKVRCSRAPPLPHKTCFRNGMSQPVGLGEEKIARPSYLC